MELIYKVNGKEFTDKSEAVAEELKIETARKLEEEKEKKNKQIYQEIQTKTIELNNLIGQYNGSFSQNKKSRLKKIFSGKSL